MKGAFLPAAKGGAIAIAGPMRRSMVGIFILNINLEGSFGALKELDRDLRHS